MKKIIFIFLILISCLCLAVVSCADKEESSTSSSSNVDGSADGYMKIGNMLMVWGDTSSSADFPISFAATPTVTATVTGANNSTDDRVTIESVTTSSVTLGLYSSQTANYIPVGTWR